VPAKLRFKPIAGRELLAAVAATRDLKVAWVRADRCAVLYEGAAAAEIERVREDLAAPDLAVRRAAAWRGGWLRDPQMVSPVVQAARSADAEVARQARLSLRRLGWAAVVAIDAGALEVIATDVAEGGDVGKAAVEALGQAAADGGAEAEKAVALCEKTLADPRPWKRRDTIRAMAEAGGKQALPFLDKALADPDISVRQMATHCLGRVGRPRSCSSAQDTPAPSSAKVNTSEPGCAATSSAARRCPNGPSA
jgi:HEAT repeat protein